jgi:FtsP/CotA-like multicopper oxidase with cupredoxin domain
VAAVRMPGVVDAAQAHYFKRVGHRSPIEKMESIKFEEAQGLASRAYQPGDPKNFVPAFSATPALADICARFDPDASHYEDWVLENWTNEIHNFHIHQTRFEVAPLDKGDARYFNFPCAGSSYPDKDRCLPKGQGRENYGDKLIKQFFKGLTSTGAHSSATRDAFHDSVPLPRGTGICDGRIWSEEELREAGDKACEPGRVTVRIRFDRREQIGTFPYHCHILEHEDRGMMALVEVK